MLDQWDSARGALESSRHRRRLRETDEMDAFRSRPGSIEARAFDEAETADLSRQA
jgi:hypothetical protein